MPSVADVWMNLRVDERTVKRDIERGAKAADVSGAGRSVGARFGSSFRRAFRDSANAGKGIGGVVEAATGFDALRKAASNANIFSRALAVVAFATGPAEASVAGLIVTTATLGATLLAGAAGAGAYGVALKPVVGQVANLMKLQQQAATGSKTAQKQLQAAIRSTPPVVVQFTKSVTDARDSYTKWGLSLAKPVLRPLQTGLRLVNPLLHAATPLVLEAAAGVNDVVNAIARKVTGGGLERFVTTVLPYVRPAMTGIARVVGDVGAGIWGVTKAFLPMQSTILGGAGKLADAFKHWAESLPSHSGFQSLMTMFREETPLANDVLRNLGTILGNIGKVMASSVMVGNATWFLQMLRSLTKLLAGLTEHQGLVEVLLYFTLIHGVLKKLKPAATGVRDVLNVLIGGGKGLLNFIRGFRDAEAAASGFTGSAGTAGGIIRNIGKRSAAAALSTTSFGTALAGVAGWVGPVAVGLGALAAAAGAAYLITRNGANAYGSYFDAQMKVYKATGFNVNGYQKLSAALADEQRKIEGVTAANLEQHGGMVQINGKWQLYVTAVKQGHEALDKVQTRITNLNSFLYTLADRYRITIPQAQGLATAAGIQSDAVADGNVKLDDAIRKTDAYRNSLKGMIDMMNAAIAPYVNTSQATLSLATDTGNLAAALNNSRGKMGLHTQAQRDSWQAFLTTITDTANLAEATRRSGGSMDDVRAKTGPYIRRLLDAAGTNKTARQAVLDLAASIGIYITDLGKIPGSRTSHIAVYASGHWDAQTIKDIKAFESGAPPPGMHLIPGGGGYEFAGGGRVPGWGGGDRRIARVEPGEAIVDKYTTAAHSRDLATWGVPGFASGGLVGQLGDWASGAFNQTSTAAAARVATSFAVSMRTAAAALHKAVQTMLGTPAQIVKYAKSWAGRVPYVWGGTTPAGWDCSGFTGYVYRHFGYNPPRTSEEQYRWVRRVPYETPAALVFFVGAGGPPPGHVGIAIGNGMMVNAAGTRVGTVISGIGANMGFGIPPGGFANMPPGYAQGTRSAAPGWGVVGERGRELVGFWGGEPVVPLDGPGLDLGRVTYAPPAPPARLSGLEERLDRLIRLMEIAPARMAVTLTDTLNGVARSSLARTLGMAR